MKSNQIQSIIQKALKNLSLSHPLLSDILQAIDKQGAVAYFVGGIVRDILFAVAENSFGGISPDTAAFKPSSASLHKQIKDIDIEVHGLSEDQLAQLLKQFGYVDCVGKSFGVFKLHGLDVDWSLPRTDSAGRKPTVVIDPHMSIEDAFRRRDLTINAMGIDAKTGLLIDPFNGQEDLNNKILRSPDLSLFEQDPLRFFRVMQFISRFAMTPDKQLEEICKSMNLAEVSRDRIEQEFAKMLLRSQHPSLGIRWLRDIGRLEEILPELAATIAVVQDHRWHPEGDVFEHSMQALDAAAKLDYDDDQEKLALLYAALCHDLGKVSTTFEDEKGIHSYGHAEVGQKIAATMLKRITQNKLLIETVAKLVRWHMVPIQLLQGGAKTAAFKRLATHLAPHINAVMLAKLVIADRRGRNPQSHEPLTIEISDVQLFLDKMQKAGVKYKQEEPLLTGKDFLDVIEPGPELGKVVQLAYELQLEGVVDKDELKRMILKGAKKE